MSGHSQSYGGKCRPILPISTDVLIVGAGPSGLTLAAELIRRGVDPVIVDRQPTGANTSRACVVHARTMEVLESLGVTTDLLAQGVKVPIFRVRDRDHALITVDFSEIASAFAFTLMIPQDKVERTLIRHLQGLGGEVVRNCELVHCEPSPDAVRTQLRFEGSTQVIQTKWLVGCDGMHSLVREQAGIPFTGGAYEESFVLADVRMDWPLSREEVTLFYSPAGLVVVAPLPDDHFRIVATVDAAAVVPTVDFVQSILDARGPSTNPARVHAVVWGSRFHIHHRVAQNPRRGRVLLCGDAAHVHSPAAGKELIVEFRTASRWPKLLPRRCGRRRCAAGYLGSRTSSRRNRRGGTHAPNDPARDDEVANRSDPEKCRHRAGGRCARRPFGFGENVSRSMRDESAVTLTPWLLPDEWSRS